VYPFVSDRTFGLSGLGWAQHINYHNGASAIESLELDPTKNKAKEWVIV